MGWPSCACALGLETDVTRAALVAEEAEEIQRRDLDPIYSLKQSPAGISLGSGPTQGGSERVITNDYCLKPPSPGVLVTQRYCRNNRHKKLFCIFSCKTGPGTDECSDKVQNDMCLFVTGRQQIALPTMCSHL